MNRKRLLADSAGLLVPMAMAVAGGWHLVVNHNGNSVEAVATELAFLYALYAAGFLFWRSISRVIGAGTTLAATILLFMFGAPFAFWSVGVFVLPFAVITSLGGIISSSIRLLTLTPGEALTRRRISVDSGLLPDLAAMFLPLPVFILPALIAVAVPFLPLAGFLYAEYVLAYLAGRFMPLPLTVAALVLAILLGGPGLPILIGIAAFAYVAAMAFAAALAVRFAHHAASRSAQPTLAA